MALKRTVKLEADLFKALCVLMRIRREQGLTNEEVRDLVERFYRTHSKNHQNHQNHQKTYSKEAYFDPQTNCFKALKED